MDYSPWDHNESDMMEGVCIHVHTHTHTHIYICVYISIHIYMYMEKENTRVSIILRNWLMQ